MFDAHRHPPPDGVEAGLPHPDADPLGLPDRLWVGTHPGDWARARRAADRTQGWLGLGLHPWWVSADWGEALAQLAGEPALDAVGECGLDRRRGPDLALQRSLFDAQLDLARERQLPVVLHVVGAWSEVQQHLRRAPLAAGGIWHGFLGHPQVADQALAEGLSLSFGPGFERSPRARDSAVRTPEDRLLVETDEDPGGPAALRQVVEQLSRLRRQEPGHLAALTTANAKALLGPTPQSLRLRSS